MTPTPEAKAKLFSIFKEHILSPTEVVRRALTQVVEERKFDADYIKAHFSELVTGTQERAYDIFLDSQRSSWRKSIQTFLGKTLPENVTRAEVAQFLTDQFEELDSFFLSLTNSRRPRAGSAFQITINELFKRLGYPLVEQPEIDGIPDFLLPSIEHFRKNPIDCIIFTVKRTLRERWRQIVTEGTRGLGFFLATIDESVSEKQLEEISANRIYLVVPIELKSDVKVYKSAVSVITFESFFEDHLDPAFRRWVRAGILDSGKLTSYTRSNKDAWRY
jgi:hypothetical protein